MWDIMRNLDMKEVGDIISNSITKKFKTTNKEKALFGFSGGLDSSTTAAVLKNALGKENVLGILMPEQGSGANQLAEKIGINYQEIPVLNLVDPSGLEGFCEDRIARGNFIARSRMAILYYLANCEDGLVIGTSNKSEIYTGYFTKFGDGASDFRPLADLYKTEVKELAKKLGVSEEVINKEPTAGFWEDQTDEDELGLTYSALDRILHSYLDLDLSEEELKQNFDYDEVERTLDLIKSTEHKRGAPEKVELTEAL